MILKAKKEFSEILISSIQARTLTKNAEANFIDLFQTTKIPKLLLTEPMKVANFHTLLKKMKNYHPLIKSLDKNINSAKRSLVFT